MDYLQTQTKGLAWCEKLKDANLLTPDNYDKCVGLYASPGLDNITIPSYPESRTSKEHSFGMTKKQGANFMYTDLTKNRQITCFMSNLEKNKYLAVDPDSADKLILLPESATGEYVVFIIKLANNGMYTVINKATGNYITVNPANGQLVVDSAVLTDNCYFKLIQTGTNKYLFTFESSVMPGKYIILDDVPHVSADGNKYWFLDKLVDGAELGSTDTDIPESRALINNLLANIQDVRGDYFVILAKIEFLKLLKTKLQELTQPTGSIVTYYKENQTLLGLSNDLINSIEFSVSNEINQNEISKINDMITELVAESQRMSSDTYMTVNVKSAKLIELLETLNAKKRLDITKLNGQISSLTNKHRSIADEMDNIDKATDALNEKLAINDKYAEHAEFQDTGYTYDLYSMVVIGIILCVCIAFFGYRLIQRYNTVF